MSAAFWWHGIRSRRPNAGAPKAAAASAAVPFRTAGNLVFQVINDGRLMAYRADTGEQLLEIQTGLGGGMGPPITYMVDGQQYVSLMGGRGSTGNPAPGGGGGDADADADGDAEADAEADADAGPDIEGPDAEEEPGNPTPKLLTFVSMARRRSPIPSTLTTTMTRTATTTTAMTMTMTTAMTRTERPKRVR